MKRHLHISRIALQLAFVFSLLMGWKVSAQTYPVQAHIVTTGPYLNYLSYYGDQNNHLQITLTNLDFNSPSVLVRLRLHIEGSGWELYTNPNATIGQPFLLDPGMPLTITGIDLLPYLLQNNLVNPNGIDLNNLPKGFTNVCVDVIRESANHEVLSTNNCGFLPIQEYQPPQAFVPACGDQLDTNTMFHNFTWTPPVPFPAGADIEVSYDFSIYHWIDPNNNSALGGNSILVYQQNDLIAPTTQVPDFDIQWQMGGTYIWTVTARVESNNMPISLIENGGVSAPCTFVYGEELSLADQLADGLEIELFTAPSSERKGKAWWTVIDNTPNQGLSTFDEYYVEYRKQPTGNEGFEIPWFSKTLTSLEHFIYQLEPSTTYQVRVSGVIAGVVGSPTPIKTFTTPDARIYNCGEADLPYLPNTFTPLENATVGTQVQIGQFTMTMTELNEFGGGHYAGKGEIPVAFLGGAKAKVRFTDILIDTEYRVHEGRVDVITEGLDNWLNEQYQQFIDPYYVNGVIDSAWVDTVAGVAWVTVDGVDQQFTFDPPTYPIIVNDENGNQYTIYPNGTIIVSNYLAISETWAVNSDEVIYFTQNVTELRGFDAKEHMQWHENYEIMMLADSSKYFVANKSLAKDEGDYVNVEIPSGVNASFEFSDGTPINALPLQSDWLGETKHIGSTKMTLFVPARSSAGNYSIYAFANNQKVGQLNVVVYSKKERELVVVPIASTNLTAAQIKAELDKTLGEANLDVDVEITPQWTDTTGTFTTSTNVSLPTEVGLLNKYSDDMREIRDLYFEQNPNSDKSKYYIFLVNGFDEPNELGYMVRGRALGFVKASQQDVLHTISHELGHGMGALAHTWKDNGPSEGTTSNLLDYNGGNNLIKAQWKELRDLDLIPSLFDAAEDGLYGFEEYVVFYQNTKTKTPIASHNKNDAFYLLNGEPYKFQPSGSKSINSVIFDRLGRVYAFKTEDFEYYEALINRTAGGEVPLSRSYLTIPEIEEYYNLSNGTGYVSTSQYEFLSNHGYQFILPTSNDSVYSRSCLYLHNGQTGATFNIEVFESCLVDRTELISSVPTQTIFESPYLHFPPSFASNDYTIIEGGNCTLPSNIGTLDQNGYGADIYYKLREDATNQTQLIELANYFSELAETYLYAFYDEETNAFEYIGPNPDDSNVQHRELTLIPEVFKRENVYSISAFKSAFPRSTWFYARGMDSIISARNIRSTIPQWYNAQSIDYTSSDYPIPSFKNWSVFDYEELEEVVDYIEDLYDAVVAAQPSYASNQNMQNTVAWIAEARSNLPLTLSYRLDLRHNIIAILNTLGAFDRYEYSILDLRDRESLVQNGGGVFLVGIQNREQEGRAVPINMSEGNTQYMSRFDTDCAFYLGFEYMKIYVENFFEPAALLNVIQKAQAVRSAFKSHKASYQKRLDDIFQGLKNSQDYITSLTNKLISRGLSSSIADDIVIRVLYIDDVIGEGKMISLLDEIVGSTKFKNPEDILENLNSVFSGNNVSTQNAKNLFKEFEEGKYWINQGDEVYISKKWTTNGNEVDITITTKSALVECKNVSGNNFKSVEDNLKLIVEKYTTESKLSSAIKSQYPNHFGKMSVVSISNPFYNSTKADFISKIKNGDVTNGQLSILGNGSNQITLVDLKKIKELHIENAQGRFVIYSTDW